MIAGHRLPWFSLEADVGKRLFFIVFVDLVLQGQNMLCLMEVYTWQEDEGEEDFIDHQENVLIPFPSTYIDRDYTLTFTQTK